MASKLAQRYKKIMKNKNLKLVETHNVFCTERTKVKARVLQYGEFVYHVFPTDFGYVLQVYRKT